MLTIAYIAIVSFLVWLCWSLHDCSDYVIKAVDPLTVIAGVGMGISALSSLFGGSDDQHEANVNNMFQWKQSFDYTKEWNLTQLQNQNRWLGRSFNFQEEEAAKQRDWQHTHDLDMWRRQYEAQVEQAQNQYQWQMDDMRKAGLNPNVMFGGGNLLSMPSTPTPSVGKGDTAHAPASYSPISANAPSPIEMKSAKIESAQMISAVGSAIGNVAGALKDSAQAKETNTLLSQKLDKLVADTKYQQEITKLTIGQQAYQEFQNSIAAVKSKWANMKESAEYTQIVEDIAVKGAQIQLLYQQGKHEEASALLAQAEELLTNQKKDQLVKESPILIANLRKLGVMYEQQGAGAIMQGQAALSQAGSSRIIALATDNEKRHIIENLKKEGQVLSNQIVAGNLDNTFNAITFRKRAQSVAEELLHNKIINQQEFQRLIRLGKENNWYEIMNTFNILTGGLIGAGAASSGTGSFIKNTSSTPSAPVIRGFK